jgi:hypothetical protein
MGSKSGVHPHVHSAASPVEMTRDGKRELDIRNGVGGGRGF